MDYTVIYLFFKAGKRRFFVIPIPKRRAEIPISTDFVPKKSAKTPARRIGMSAIIPTATNKRPYILALNSSATSVWITVWAGTNINELATPAKNEIQTVPSRGLIIG